MSFCAFFRGTYPHFFDRRLRHFAIVHCSEQGEDVRLNDGVHQREQHADNDGQDKGERDIVVHELRHEHAAQQRAEQTEAHRNGQGEFLEREQQPASLVCSNTADEDKGIAEAPQGDRAVDVGEGGGQRDAGVIDRLPGNADELKERSEEDISARRKDIGAQHVVAMGAVAARHTVEESHRLL